jgi:hypothetical protein
MTKALEEGRNRRNISQHKDIYNKLIANIILNGEKSKAFLL